MFTSFASFWLCHFIVLIHSTISILSHKFRGHLSPLSSNGVLDRGTNRSLQDSERNDGRVLYYKYTNFILLGFPRVCCKWIFIMTLFLSVLAYVCVCVRVCVSLLSVIALFVSRSCPSFASIVH